MATTEESTTLNETAAASGGTNYLQKLDAIGKFLALSGKALPGMMGGGAPGGTRAGGIPGTPGLQIPSPLPPTQQTVAGGGQPQQAAQRSPVGGPGVSPTALGYGGPGTRPIPTPSGYETGFSFPTKSARTMAVTQGAIKNITEAAQQFKQQRWQKEAAQTEQAVGNYVTLLQKADEEQDPQKKQQLLQMAEQAKTDKTVAKLLEKAQKDPMSGAGVGFQRATQAAIQKGVQQAQLDSLRAEAAANFQKVLTSQAEAKKFGAEAEEARQKAAAASPEEVEKLSKQKAQQDLDKAKYIQGEKLKQVQEVTRSSLDRVKISAKATVDAARIRADAMTKVAGIRNLNPKQKQAVDFLDKAYKNLLGEAQNLEAQYKGIQAHMDKQGLIGGWLNADDMQINQNKLAALEIQMQQNKQKRDQLDNQRLAAIQAGAMPPEATPTPDTVVIDPNAIINAPDDTADVVVKPEDMPK